MVFNVKPAGRAGDIVTFKGLLAKNPAPPYAVTGVKVMAVLRVACIEEAKIDAVIAGAGAIGTTGEVALYFDHNFLPAENLDPPICCVTELF